MRLKADSGQYCFVSYTPRCCSGGLSGVPPGRTLPGGLDPLHRPLLELAAAHILIDQREHRPRIPCPWLVGVGDSQRTRRTGAAFPNRPLPEPLQRVMRILLMEVPTVAASHFLRHCRILSLLLLLFHTRVIRTQKNAVSSTGKCRRVSLARGRVKKRSIREAISLSLLFSAY